VILEKDDIPIAGMMDIDEFEDYLELQDPKVRARVGRLRNCFASSARSKGQSSPNPGGAQRLDAVVFPSHDPAL
jgi:hypothetical protein